MTRGAISAIAECSDTVLTGLRDGAHAAQETVLSGLDAFDIGDLNLHLREAVKEALRLDIKDCRFSREGIADRLSYLAGRQVGRSMIDAWVAVTNANSIPAYLTPLWARAAESTRVLEILAAAAGMYLADQRTHDLAKLAETDIEAEQIQRRRRQLEERLGV